MKEKVPLLIIGSVGIITIAPSLATSFWMWKERPQYRWALILNWAIVLGGIYFLYEYMRRE